MDAACGVGEAGVGSSVVGSGVGGVVDEGVPARAGGRGDRRVGSHRAAKDPAPLAPDAVDWGPWLSVSMLARWPRHVRWRIHAAAGRGQVHPRRSARVDRPTAGGRGRRRRGTTRRAATARVQHRAATASDAPPSSSPVSCNDAAGSSSSPDASGVSRARHACASDLGGHAGRPGRALKAHARSLSLTLHKTATATVGTAGVVAAAGWSDLGTKEVDREPGRASRFDVVPVDLLARGHGSARWRPSVLPGSASPPTLRKSSLPRARTVQPPGNRSARGVARDPWDSELCALNVGDVDRRYDEVGAIARRRLSRPTCTAT